MSGCTAYRKSLLTGTALVLLLSACGGSGGASFQSDNVRIEVGDVDQDDQAASTPTGEQEESWGYDNSRAAAALSSGIEGDGALVALIDSGLSTNDADLLDRIDSRSRGFDRGTLTGINDVSPGRHGSVIANIVAATNDGVGVTGIAPEADLLILRAQQPDREVLFNGDIQLALNVATAANADVINLSLSSAGPSTLIREALVSATRGDSVVVVAAGNNGSDLTYPARYVADNDFFGRMIAVGSIDEDGEISSFSSRPGDSAIADHFMVAPGGRVDAIADNQDLGVVSGTSFSAPYVSGAAALVRSEFPFMTAEDVAELLLSTATDLGAPGTDPIYGRGLLNVEAAFEPSGQLTVASGSNVSDRSATLAATELSIGAAFGDALQGFSSIADTVAFDDFGRAFDAGLEQRITTQTASGWLENRIAADGDFDVRAGAAEIAGMRTEFTLGELAGRQSDHYWAMHDGDPNSVQTGSFLTRSDLVDGTSISFGMGLAPNAMQDMHGKGSKTASPLTAFSEDVAGLALDHSITSDLKARVFLQQGDGTGNASVISSGAMLSGGETWQWQAGLLHVHEDQGALGSSGEGAFAGSQEQATSQFVTGSVKRQAGALDVSLSAHVGMTAIDGDDGLLRYHGPVVSTGFEVEAGLKGVIVDQDRLSFSVSQPLRVESGEIGLRLPTGRTDDGRVLYSSERGDAAPSGRAIDLDLSYAVELSEHANVTGFSTFRHEPGHDSDADDEVIVGAKFSLKW